MKAAVLISLVMAVIAMPAMATEPDIPANEPNPPCDSGVLKTTDGSATLNAIWNAIEYQCQPGQYLSTSDADYHQCPANSYCNGNGTYTYTDGVDGCLSACPNGYPYSIVGSNSDEMCYNTSTVQCSEANPYFGTHGSADYTNSSVACRNYAYQLYDSAADPCKFTAVGECAFDVVCDSGYTKIGSFGDLYDYVSYSVPQDTNHIRFNDLDNDDLHDDRWHSFGDQTELNNGDWEVAWGDGTTVRGTSSCNASGQVFDYLKHNISGLISNTISVENFISGFRTAGATDTQISLFQDTLSDFLSGRLSLEAAYLLLVKKFAVDYSANHTATVTGDKCWCKITRYKKSNDGQYTQPDSIWVTKGSYDDGQTGCTEKCTRDCASLFARGGTEKVTVIAMLGDLASFPTCEPNTINLNWNPNNGNANTQSQCIYDGVITLPDEPSKPGYTFGGWSVQTQSQQNQGD